MARRLLPLVPLTQSEQFRLFVAVLFLAIAVAATVPVKAQETQPTIIRAGVLIDGTGNPPRRDVSIIIHDGRIVEVRPAMEADAKTPGALDLSEWYILPGLKGGVVEKYDRGR